MEFQERQKGFLEGLKKLNDEFKCDISATFQASSNKLGDIIAVPFLIDTEKKAPEVPEQSPVVKP